MTSPVPKPAPRAEAKRLPIPRHAVDRRVRLAKRRAKASAIGSPLAHHGSLLKIADDLWSVWVRAKASGCEMCLHDLHPAELQDAHGFSRAERRIRFHDDNHFALCPADHLRNTPPGPEWWEWMTMRLGPDRFKCLRLLRDIGPKLTTGMLELVILDAQQRIAVLRSGRRKQWAEDRAVAITARLVSFGRARVIAP